MRTKQTGTCPRYYYVKTPPSIRGNSTLCCRIAQSLNDTAAYVRAGRVTRGELQAAQNLAIAIGVPIREDWYGKGPGEVEFDCDFMKLSTKLTSRKKRTGGKGRS